MKYSIEEITTACASIGLSKAIIIALINKLPYRRTNQQNKALYVLFQNMSFELNRISFEFTFNGITGVTIQMPYTPEIVKEFIWKPLQNALLSKSSTTELTGQDINLIFEILGKWFAEKGCEIHFPSAESLAFKQLK